MGIRGFKTFLVKANLTFRVDIGEDVKKWKRENAGESPIIVIDFLNLTYCIALDKSDSICGGRHQNVLQRWENILKAFKNTGCSLVFFSDLNTSASKVEEWLSRRNVDFNVYTNFYNSFGCGKSIKNILSENGNVKAPNATFYDMAMIAQEYGEFHYSVQYDNDLEIAHYAKCNNALAVVSNDTDFLIFDGSWKFWSSENIELSPLTAIEWNRNGLLCNLGLNRHQMPLFATLMGSDVTKGHLDKLRTCLGFSHSFKEVASYVRKRTSDDPSSDIMHNFQNINDDIRQLILKSIDSYNIDFSHAEIDDPLEKKLLETQNKVYRFYMALTSSIQGIPLPFYDMRGCQPKINLSMLIIAWTKRKVGILMQHKDKSYTFTFMAKKNVNEPFMEHKTQPLYPEFSVPPLEELYLGSGTVDKVEINESRWTIFQWIMYMSSDRMSLIKQLPKEFRLTCTILYALVKVNLISMKEADGILYTERMANTKKDDLSYPKIPNAQWVRAAHMYNISFAHVRENFAIAGLLSEIKDVIQFDGVYYQKIMEQWTNNNDAKEMMNAIKMYRIYANMRQN